MRGIMKEQIKELLLQDDRIKPNNLIATRELKRLFKDIYEKLGIKKKAIGKHILEYLPAIEKRYYNKETKKVTRGYIILE